MGLTAKRIGIVAFENVTASHVICPFDAFAAAALHDGFGNRLPCYEVWLVSFALKPVRSEAGTTLQPQKTFRNAPAFDTILIPGGSGVRVPETNRAIAQWIRRSAPRTRRIACACTGIYGLAPTGLLDGREVTTHWRCANDVARRFPRLRVNHKKALVRDGPFYTATGITAGLFLAMALIEEDYGKYVALAAAQELMTRSEPAGNEEREPINIGAADQVTERFAELVAWIVRNLQADLSVEALARRACICPSHFSRAFKSVFGTSPAEFVENLRLNEARRRLSTRHKTLQSVAASVGFRNADAFHRAFARRFGTRPGEYLNGATGSTVREEPDAREALAALEAQPSAR